MSIVWARPAWLRTMTSTIGSLKTQVSRLLTFTIHTNRVAVVHRAVRGRAVDRPGGQDRARCPGAAARFPPGCRPGHFRLRPVGRVVDYPCPIYRRALAV